MHLVALLLLLSLPLLVLSQPLKRMLPCIPNTGISLSISQPVGKTCSKSPTLGSGICDPASTTPSHVRLRTTSDHWETTQGEFDEDVLGLLRDGKALHDSKETGIGDYWVALVDTEEGWPCEVGSKMCRPILQWNTIWYDMYESGHGCENGNLTVPGEEGWWWRCNLCD